jgi:hypothetical protein
MAGIFYIIYYRKLNLFKEDESMRKLLFILLILVLTLTFAIPIGISADAPSTVTKSVVSDTDVQIIGVYNKYLGATNFNDLSSSPLSAVRAAEPNPYATGYANEPPESDGSAWDDQTGYYFQTTNPGADWIWETVRAEDPATVYSPSSPLYDNNSSSNGRVVVFEKGFFLPGTPTSATLNITADNCYEVWINGEHIKRSATAKVDDWQLTGLQEPSVGSQGWQNVGHWAVSNSYLNANDNNTITIMAGNEYYHPDNASYEFNNSPCPPFVAGERQQNPGALIFKLDIEYEPYIPPPPLPELPSGILFGLGILGVGGFMLLRKGKADAAK